MNDLLCSSLAVIPDYKPEPAVLLCQGDFEPGRGSAGLNHERREGRYMVCPYRVRGGAAGVGEATTSAVVSSIFLIILTDSLFSVILRYWG